ncbi:MAG: acetyl-CoA carboxylase biotin carboxylase subunit [Bacteroidia bacterium]|nr:acetyl-CoA carboxylase biotin carboxylase subunit [Bacteroidia bacterium]
MNNITKVSKISKVLVANRGEIAIRIMRSLHEMQIASVAVYSTADRNALHVRFAQQAFCIGEPASTQSYLRGDKIIEVAIEAGCDAIHPGYGFLSENAAFADAVKAAGLIFIGPSAESMNKMGDKISAKNTAKSFNIPLVPGIDYAIRDIEEAKKIAHQIGFPVLIKASAGGGGKGMRIVHDAASFEELLKLAQSEAMSSFNDDAVFIEKYVAKPRHIEVQVLGDMYGNLVYLFERECSVQRRHQKVIEEAPSSILTPDLRKKMGECAVQAARSCNYYNAGTVEFLMDEQLNFYFLEMNTRLQVEHPVSEIITGLDLVKEQIKIAEGQELSFKQDDLKINGHAIEVRVYAEDPLNQFLPDIGKLVTYKIPQGPGVRVDDAYEEGMDIPIYYDPMIAKLITHAESRQAAIDKMIQAIDNYQISGVATTLGFCKFVMQHEAFVSGNFDTHFVPLYFKPEVLTNNGTDNDIAVLMAAMVLSEKQQIIADEPYTATSNWKRNRQ